MEMVMPRAFSSGALSIWSKAVKATLGFFSARALVMAAVRVVLPWSMWPIVPTLLWGLERSNFCFAMFSFPGGAPTPPPRRAWGPTHAGAVYVYVAAGGLEPPTPRL